MEYYINLISKRVPGSSLVSMTRVHSPIEPSEEEFERWKLKTIDCFVKGIQHEPIVINITEDKFVRLIYSLYRKIGKKIEQCDKNSLTFKISTKHGSFYEEIDHLWLYSPEYKSNIAVIKIKQL